MADTPTIVTMTREPDPWRTEVINAMGDCVHEFMRLGRVANQKSYDSHGVHAVEAVKWAAFFSLILEAVDKMLFDLLTSANNRLEAIDHTINPAILQEELFHVVNAFIARGEADGMAGWEFLRQKYRDDMNARFPKL